MSTARALAPQKEKTLDLIAKLLADLRVKLAVVDQRADQLEELIKSLYDKDGRLSWRETAL